MKKIISIFFSLIYSLIFCVNYSLADEIGGDLNNNLLNESKSDINKNKKNYNIDNPKSSSEDIFGDEQAFPFVAGLGKNAAH